MSEFMFVCMLFVCINVFVCVRMSAYVCVCMYLCCKPLLVLYEVLANSLSSCDKKLDVNKPLGRTRNQVMAMN